MGFLILVNESIRSSVYLSDNVLLPGLVQCQFESEFISKELLAGNKEETRRTPEKNPHAWIASQFQQLGPDVNTLNTN